MKDVLEHIYILRRLALLFSIRGEIPMLMLVAKTLIRTFPTGAATRLAIALASRTQRPGVKPQENEIMDAAVRIGYGPRFANTAWSWGSGPLVVLVHGWNGRASQMAVLAKAIADAGFRAVAIDVTGHGASPGSSTGWAIFMRDIAALTDALQSEVYAYVGHSAGGLALMAARRTRGVKAKRLVCIAAPSYPFPPVTAIRKRLSPPARVIERYQGYLASQFETQWESLAKGSSFEGAGSDLLLIYDEDDRYVSHTEADRIQVVCPGARVMKTKGTSHSRVLAAPEVSRGVIEFLVGTQE